MKAFFAALITASAYATSSLKASTICVHNKAWFDLYWYQDDLIIGQLGAESSTYPIDQTRCMPVNVNGAKQGDLIQIYIKAILGARITADSIIIYDNTAPLTATFQCNGTTFDYTCKLEGISYANQLFANEMYEELEDFTSRTGFEIEASKFLQ